MKRILFFLTSALTIQTSFAYVPTLATTFSTDVEVFNATSSQRIKIETAEDLIKQVIATEEFRNAVLNHTYAGVKKFVDNNGLTNLQIYNKILDGAEVLNNIKNNTMNLEIQTYYESSTTVGYTYANSKRIYMNTKYLNTYTPSQVTRNMIHEWLHKLGFKHAVSYSTSRDYSVPYGVGSIVESIAKKIVASSYFHKPVSNLALSSTSSSLTLKWSAATASAGIKEYKIYRKLDGSSYTYLQGTTSNLSFTQSLPTKSAEFYVKSIAKDGKSVNSTKIYYTKKVTLTSPTNLTLSKTTYNVVLKWGASSASEGIQSYKIYRRLDGYTTNYLQGSTTSLSYSQSKPTRSAYYYIKAVDKAGNTVKSGEVKYVR